jgi:hypothetical protein
MAGRFVYDLVEPALLTQYVRQFDNEILKNQLYLEQFLPNQLNDELEWRATKSTLRDVDVAEYRAFDTPATMTGRQGWNRLRGELAPVSREIPLGEEEMLRLRAIRETGADTALLNQIYDDAESMTRAVQMRIEMARAQVLYTGAFTLAENGLILTADFGMSGTHKPTAGTVWSNAAAPILTDLLAWTQLYVDDNGSEPAMILMSRQALGYFYTNTQMLGAAAFAGTTPSRLNNEMVDAILAANGLPPITLYDVKARVNGVQTRLIPANRVLLLPDPSEPLGATHYGITAEAIRLASKGMIEQSSMPGIVAVQLENDSPVQSSVLATAIAVPVMPNPDLVIAATAF